MAQPTFQPSTGRQLSLDQPGLLHQQLDRFRRGSSTFTLFNGPIVIGNGPCGCFCILDESGNQMQVQVLSTFTEGNRIDPITSGERLHKRTGVANSSPPVSGLLVVEINRTRNAPNTVKKQPAGQRRWIGMMTQDPESVALNLIALDQADIGMNSTDGTLSAPSL